MAKKGSSRRAPPTSRAPADAKPVRPVGEGPVRSTDELIHDLEVHQIELEMQNEELRRIQTALEESHERYVDLYDFAPVGYLTLSLEAEITAINLAGVALLGANRNELIRRRFTSFVAADSSGRWHRFFLGVLQQHDRQTCELVMRCGDGSHFHARLECTRPEREAPEVRIVLTDISERVRAEEEIRIAATAFDSQEAMIITDPNGVIVRVNRAFTKLTGYHADEVIGRFPSLLTSACQDKAFYDQILTVLAQASYWQGEIWIRQKNGQLCAEWLTISAVIAPDGAVTHYIGGFSDITKNKEAEAEIHRLAYYDPLTGLPNRRLFNDRIIQGLAGSNRNRQYGSLLFLDLDQFKTLNDTRGHDVGDQLLIETSRRIVAGVRASDTVARLGGDEFVVMLENLGTDVQEAAIQTGLVAEKLRQSLARPYELGDLQYNCAASIGAALFHGHDESVETLLKHADIAMYQAKSAGRNTLRFFDPAMQTTLDQRSALETDLRLAVGRGQLCLFYQPQIDGAGRVIGAEVLLRWSHPELGLILPDDFIHLAEDTGLIVLIGHWVLETVCAQIVTWAGSPVTRTLRLAVNISPRQFRNPEFVPQVKKILAQTGADPTRLKMEVTESLIIDDVADTTARMQELKEIGIEFSIDDFGTGFSSLSYLKRLPLDEFKIDRTFIRDIAGDPNDAAIVRTIITMGEILGLDVIAEGVETQAQLVLLRAYGCIAYQGYLFARPQSLAAFEEIVHRGAIHPVPWLT